MELEDYNIEIRDITLNHDSRRFSESESDTDLIKKEISDTIKNYIMAFKKIPQTHPIKDPVYDFEFDKNIFYCESLNEIGGFSVWWSAITKTTLVFWVDLMW